MSSISDPKTNKLPELPDLKTFCCETPLYESVPFDFQRDTDWLLKLRVLNFQFDAYCVGCKMLTTFRTFRDPPDTHLQDALQNRMTAVGKRHIAGLVLPARLVGVHMTCQRLGHPYDFIFKAADGTVTKVGQAPRSKT